MPMHPQTNLFRQVGLLTSFMNELVSVANFSDRYDISDSVRGSFALSSG